MAISLEKTVATVYGVGFNNHCSLRVGGAPAKFQATPRFLGVRLDRELNFKAHAKAVLWSARRRLLAVRKLATATWRPRSVHIYTLYIGVVESVLFYAAGAWLPRAGAAVWTDFERLQVEGAAVVLGVPHSLVNRDAILFEAGLVVFTIFSILVFK